jgi:hypothetical protein
VLHEVAERGGDARQLKRAEPARGVHGGDEQSELLTTDAVQACDIVITMGCGDACTVFPGKRSLDRDLPDPAGMASTRSGPSATRSTPASAPCSPNSPPEPADTDLTAGQGLTAVARMWNENGVRICGNWNRSRRSTVKPARSISVAVSRPE